MRKPAVAGSFYPREKNELLEMLKKFDEQTPTIKENPLSGVSPHAGYIYSGGIATYTYKAIKNVDPRVIAIVGPDHIGIATNLNETAISIESWETPLGKLDVDKEIAERIASEVPNGNLDPAAHELEHSIEVQLPFIQYFIGDVKIVPIMLGDQSLEIAISVGEALAKELPEESVVVASSDMSHYVPVEQAEKNDKYAIEGILKMDEEEFYRRISEKNVTACGYGAIVSAEVFAKKRKGKVGKLLKYGTSSSITKEAECVGYASIIFV